MGMTSKPSRAVFVAMEELGLGGWLPGSARRIAVSTGSATSERSMRAPVRKHESLSTRRSPVAVPTLLLAALGAVAFVATLTLFNRRR